MCMSLLLSIILVFRFLSISIAIRGPSWPWSYGSWIFNYLCNRCLSPLKLWVRIPLRRDEIDTLLCDTILSVTFDRSVFFSCTPVSSTSKHHHRDITEILLKYYFVLTSAIVHTIILIIVSYFLLNYKDLVLSVFVSCIVKVHRSCQSEINLDFAYISNIYPIIKVGFEFTSQYQLNIKFLKMK